MLNRSTKIIFKIISDCNNCCDFCSEKMFLNKNKPRLALYEIVENCNYFSKHFSMDSVIVSGGEPTLHPEYFTILDFLSKRNMRLKIITNLVKFSDKSFAKMHREYFTRNRDWEIYGSVHSMPLKETEPNIVGLRNILKNKMPLSLIVVVHKNNFVQLPGLMKYICKAFYASGMILRLELRLLYIEDVCDSVMTQAPSDFNRLVYCFEECLKLLNNNRHIVTLWNFPICYLSGKYGNLDVGVEKRKGELMLKIDKDNQTGNFKSRDFRTFFYKGNGCLDCKLFESCSGINKEYIDNLKFPLLSPITN